jgi:hypothetical protein
MGSGSTLQTLVPADDPAVASVALRAMGRLVVDGRLRELVIRKVDGLPIVESPWREALMSAGFTPGYRGLTLRGSR